MSLPARKLVTILFDGMTKDNLSLVDKLLPYNFSNKFVGITGSDGDVFKYTQQRLNQDFKEKADIGLSEAVASDDFKNIDILFVPGGIGVVALDYALSCDSIRNLVDAATWVVTLSQGSFIVAATGRLDQKKATSHHLWMAPTNLNPWPNVKWDSKTEVVEDDKFITAYHSINQLLSVLATKFDLPAPENPPALPSLDQLTLNTETQHWADLMRRMHSISLQKVENERAQGVDVSQETLDAYPFIRSPATAQAIREKETALGVQLPSDYKNFLQVTNGTGFSGVGSIPNLLPVEELEWQQASECGFEELRLDTFPPSVTSQLSTIELSSEEFSDAPAFERVLQISDPDQDAIICLLDPEYVRKTWTWLAERRSIPVGNGQDPWLMFLFVPWMAKMKIWSSFEEYMKGRVPRA